MRWGAINDLGTHAHTHTHTHTHTLSYTHYAFSLCAALFVYFLEKRPNIIKTGASDRLLISFQYILILTGKVPEGTR